MGPSKNSRYDARQVSVLVAAMLWAVVLLALAPGARGEAAAQPNADGGNGGSPYVAGELLVLYEPGTSAQTERAVVRGSGGRTLEDFSGKVRLVSFPSI